MSMSEFRQTKWLTQNFKNMADMFFAAFEEPP